MKRIICLCISLLSFSVSVVAQNDGTTLILVTHDSFAVSEDIVDYFQEESGIRLQIVRSGDAGLMVNQSILSKENPLGDVMFGIDNTFLGRALQADIFEPYVSPVAKLIPDEFKLDPMNRVTPVDYGDVCLNYDVAYFTENNLALPTSLGDLVKPEYRSLMVVENPTTSSPGLAFMLTTVAQFGTQGNYTYLDFWRDLVANDVYISDSWTDAYYTQFSGSAGSEGTRPLVVSYASSPPAEVYFADPQPESAPTGSIIADDTCFRQVEFVGILKGTKELEAAQELVDFLLSRIFQEDMPLQMFVFPVNPQAVLPEVFTQYATIPSKSAVLDILEIDEHREEWLQAWIETVLR